MRELEQRSGNGEQPDWEEGVRSESDSAEDEPAPGTLDRLDRLTRRHVAGLLTLVLLLLIAAVVPPLLNMSRYKRQIAGSISASLGRPVHIDDVTLDLLPMPGFTLKQFNVSEDPAFGAEPVIHADTVRATLRVSSLWRRRVEFSKITLEAPSVNLVHLPDGRWNLESILLQASRMPAAPTAQHTAGPAQRFPYIQAMGARLNLKLGLEKTPFSLTEADFALWLPEPELWHLRLVAHPARTDTATTDTGTLRAEGTLGHAPRLAAVPLSLKGSWTAAPLGAVSRVLLGHDAGFRGVMNLRVAVDGTMGQNTVETKLSLADLRRADFVPEHMLDVEVGCRAAVAEVFHAIRKVDCTWPAESAARGLHVSGSVPELRQPGSAALTADLNDVPAAALLTALRMASSRVAPELTLSGRLDGRLSCCTPPPPHSPKEAALDFAGVGAAQTIGLGLETGTPFVEAATLPATVTAGTLRVSQIPLALGAREPAMLDLTADRSGLTWHLTGSALRSRLQALATALPLVGDGLMEALPPAEAPAPAVEAPIRLDLSSTRRWSGGQSWTQAPAAREKNARRPRR